MSTQAIAQLRRILAATHPDAEGWAVVRADRVQLVLAGLIERHDALIEWLVRDLARATGQSEGQIRVSHGMEAPGPTQGHPTGTPRQRAWQETGKEARR